MLPPSYELLKIADDKNDETQPLTPSRKKVLGLMEKFNAQMSVRMMFPWVVGGLSMWLTLGF
jgi:hypothetical protein